MDWESEAFAVAESHHDINDLWRIANETADAVLGLQAGHLHGGARGPRKGQGARLRQPEAHGGLAAPRGR
eukprot:4878884-Alexandrium_andersonii.AAC.1